MKKNLLFAFSVLLISGKLMFAQTTPYYSFSQSTSAYANLTGTTSVNNNGVWNFTNSGATAYYPLSITSLVPNFQLFTDACYAMRIYGGYLQFYDASSQQLHYISGFGLTDGMKDKGTSSSLSPISYVVTGTSPNRILKVEWKNATHPNNPSDVINVQIWLYQTSNVVEIHYGPSTITNSSTVPFVVGIGHTYQPNSNVIEDDFLTGTPASPVISATFSNFTGVPANGAVYKFTPGSVGVKELAGTLSGLKIFPNPSSNGVFTLDVKNVKEDLSNAKLTVVNVIGDVVSETSINDQASVKLDLSAMPKGIYFVKIYNGKEFASEKIIIQ